MNALRAICRRRLHAVLSSPATVCRSMATIENRYLTFPVRFYRFGEWRKSELNRQRRMLATNAYYNWNESKSPYETLGLKRDANTEQINAAYRRLAKLYNPDVYDGRGSLDEGETVEARFRKIQTAYELLIDVEKRKQYDYGKCKPVNNDEASQEEWKVGVTYNFYWWPEFLWRPYPNVYTKKMQAWRITGWALFGLYLYYGHGAMAMAA